MRPETAVYLEKSTMNLLARRVPSSPFVVIAITTIPGRSGSLLGAITVTGVPAGTSMTWPPTVISDPDPLATAPFVMRVMVPFVILLESPPSALSEGGPAGAPGGGPPVAPPPKGGPPAG